MNSFHVVFAKRIGKQKVNLYSSLVVHYFVAGSLELPTVVIFQVLTEGFLSDKK